MDTTTRRQENDEPDGGAPSDVITLLYSEMRDALAHLSNHAYLARHPLLARLQQQAPAGHTLTAPDLIGLLTKLLETLRPAPDLAPSDPAWRPYLVLRKRYLEGLEAETLGQDMGLSLRQVQREQRLGLLALAQAFASRLDLETARAADAGDVLSNEIRRVGEERQVFDARKEANAGLATVKPLAASRGVTLDVEFARVPMVISGQPIVFRQLFIATASQVLNQVQPTALRISLARYGNEVVLSLVAAAPEPAAVELVRALPGEIEALARSQEARLETGTMGTNWFLHMRLEAAGGEFTVALVDDDRDLAMLFARYVKGQGYALRVINDGALALQQLGEIRPDVIVLDVMMRGMDGWELLRHLKADPTLNSVPVIVCSVLNQPELAQALGADAYLIKPVRRESFLDCLAKVLNPSHSGHAESP